jgi:hypothetical protein
MDRFTNEFLSVCNSLIINLEMPELRVINDEVTKAQTV